MARQPDSLTAVAIEAGKLLQELKINELPVDPFEIAEQLGIKLKSLPKTAGGASGMLLHVNGVFGICYPTHLENQGFVNFSVAHEIGHFRLPGHVDAVLDEQGQHFSQAGFRSNNSYEKEADRFAAALLMPATLFRTAMRRAGEGLKAIETLADVCKTSLEATAIRYTQISQDPVAIIVSEGSQISHCFMSNSLKKFSNLDWISKKTPLPENSVTAAFNADSKNIEGANRKDGESTLQDWFNGPHRQEIYEEVIGLGSYGKTLTVLTGMEPPDEIEEDEDGLEESWTPRFHK